MNRDPQLQELSRDHHRGLVFARRVSRWALETATSRQQRWAAVKAFYDEHLRPHFEDEEERVLPRLAPRYQPMVARTLADHRRMRELARHGSTARDLAELGTLLRTHIRFEERELFPTVELTL